MRSNKLKPLVIGNITIEHPLALAPMAGVTDLPYRLLCKEQGAGMMCTEMVSAKGLYYGNRKSEPLMATDPKEIPVAIQIFGSDPEIMGQMAAKVNDGRFQMIDINMGCPVPKIVNNGDGSALMKNPELAGKVIKAVVDAVDIPVTVKIRKGFNDESDQCTRDGTGCTGEWSSSNCSSWKNKRTVLFRNSRLVDYPQGKRSC